MDLTTGNILTIAGMIVTVLGLLFGLLKWALSEYNKQTTEHRKALQQTINQNYAQVTKSMQGLQSEFERHRNDIDKRVNDIEKEHYKFREHVADKFVKKEHWLEHAVTMERKMENIVKLLTNDVKDLYKQIVESVKNNRGNDNGAS